MKPSQNHRIIRDKATVSHEELLPQNNSSLMIGTQSHKDTKKAIPSTLAPLQGIGGGGMGLNQAGFGVGHGFNLGIGANQAGSIALPRIDRNTIATTGVGGGEKGALNNSNETILSLQKRIKDLEKENYRLNHHVQQAEQTLRSYREVFGNLPTDLPTPAQSQPNTSRTTASNSSSSSNAPITSTSTNAAAVKENLLPSVNNGKDQTELIEKLTAKFTGADNRYKETLAKNQELVQEKEKLIANFTQTIDTFKQQIRSLTGQSEKHEMLINTLTVTNQQQKEEIISLKMKISSLSSPMKRQEEYTRQKSQMETALIAYAKQVREYKNYQLEMKKGLEEELNHWKLHYHQQIESLQNYFSLLLDNTLQQLQQQKSEYIVYKVESERTIHTQQQQVKDLEDELHKLKHQKLAVSPSGKSLISPTKGGTASGGGGGTALTPKKAAAKAVEEMDIINKEIEKLQKLAKEYERKFDSTTQAVSNLSDLHLAEVKSIKHLAHIRELIRVAKEREQAIDKDRMIIEIKQLK